VVLSGRILRMGFLCRFVRTATGNGVLCGFVRKNTENGVLCGVVRKDSGKGVFIWFLLVSPRKCWDGSLLQLLYPNSFSNMSYNHPHSCH